MPDDRDLLPRYHGQVHLVEQRAPRALVAEADVLEVHGAAHLLELQHVGHVPEELLQLEDPPYLVVGDRRAPDRPLARLIHERPPQYAPFGP
jgi:hypothetical protein